MSGWRTYEARLDAVLRALPGPAEQPVRAPTLRDATRVSVAFLYPALEALRVDGLVESRLETDEEVPAGGLRGTRWRQTARGAWRVAGLA